MFTDQEGLLDSAFPTVEPTDCRLAELVISFSVASTFLPAQEPLLLILGEHHVLLKVSLNGQRLVQPITTGIFHKWSYT